VRFPYVVLIPVVTLCACASPAPAPRTDVAKTSVPVKPPAKSAEPVASSTPPPAQPEPPEADDEPVDSNPKLSLDNGMDLVVLLDDSSPNSPELAIELRREGKVVERREGWDTITHFDLKKLHPCDTWRSYVQRESLGAFDGVRVTLVCQVGEDYATSDEIAVLLRTDRLDTVWAGIADGYHNTMDSCILRRQVTFRISSPKTLVKTIAEETRWIDQVIDDDVKRRLKRDCKLGRKERVERITLP
jgi:hypothetical protein